MARGRGCAGRLLFLQHGHQPVSVRLSDDRGCRSCGTDGLGTHARGSTTASRSFSQREGKKVSDLSCRHRRTQDACRYWACLQHHHHQADSLPCVFLVFHSISDPADTVHCHSALLHVVHIQRDAWFQCDTSTRCLVLAGGSSG